MKINGADPDFHRRDLWDAIEAGDFPEWELGLQLFDAETAALLPFDVLDPTKLITEELVPVRRVGRLVLDRNVKNSFAETEQVAFGTQNIVPGIEFSNDPLAAGAQLLLPRYAGEAARQPELRRNCRSMRRSARSAISSRTGIMATFNPSGRVNYEPELVARGPSAPARRRAAVSCRTARTSSGAKRRARPESFADHYNQARQFYASQTPLERQHIAAALVFELSKVETRGDPLARRRAPAQHRRQAGDERRRRLAARRRCRRRRRVSCRRARICRSRRRSASCAAAPQTFSGRKLGALVTDGVDGGFLRQLETEFNDVGATVELVAPAIGGVKSEDGAWIEAKQDARDGAVGAVRRRRDRRRAAGEQGDREEPARVRVRRRCVTRIASSSPIRRMRGRCSSGRSRAAPLDGGCKQVETAMAAAAFAALCAQLRFWAREPVLGL